MAKITNNANVGDSPVKGFISDFNIAFAQGDAGFIIKHVSDNIQWHIYGDKDIVGKEAFINEINIMKEYTADELVIHSIITDEAEGAINGEMKMGDQTYVFCDVYKFTDKTSQIISLINSYVIKI